MSERATVPEPVERALAESQWESAHELLLKSGVQTPEALEALSRTQWWTGLTLEALESRERAYTGYRERGDTLLAARAALWLSDEHAAVADHGALADGWLERAASLLDGRPPSVEIGWLALSRGRQASNPQAMEQAAQTALSWARRGGDADLEVRALAQLALALAGAGRVEDGFRRVDEAIVAATSEPSLQLETAGEAFCAGFALMEMVGESDRLRQWAAAMMGFVRRHDYGPVVAFCGTCCGELMKGSGDLAGAERELTSALSRLEATSGKARCVHPAAKLAELRLIQGRPEEANRLLDGYRGLPETARAEARLALAEDKPALAVGLLERRLHALGEDGPRSVPYLVLLVEAQLTLDETGPARDTVERLSALATMTHSERIEGDALAAAGQLALAEGDPEAGALLERALDVLIRTERPLDAAAVRLSIARFVVSRNSELAAAEARAALAAFERMGARGDADAAAALLRDLGEGAAPGPRTAGVLTRREREVLTALGEGLTNAEIAERLYISPKTVDHHVSRILAKLGVRNRTEAAAAAVREAAR